jgi:hypothetical protein
MDYTTYSVEQLKTLHNTTLATARTNAEVARDVRDELVAREGRYRGPSQGHLDTGVRALYDARTFSGAPHDLPVSENPYRDS